MTHRSSSSSFLTIRQARRIALAAQGFAPSMRNLSRPDRRHLVKVFDKVGIIQIDSVNVLERSHFLPLFSRLGPYRKSLLEDAAYCARENRRLFEYWGHEASLLPVKLEPVLRWRMARATQGRGVYKEIYSFGRDNATKVEDVFAQVRERGPVGVSDLSGAEKRKGPWWGWHDSKIALEWLFWTGRISTAGRRNFERIYDLPERVIPAKVRAIATPPEADAQRALVAIAARAMGIATETDLRDYFRMTVADTKSRIDELLEERTLIAVDVEGWKQQAYLYADAAIPSRVRPRALLSPFDSLIWDRARTERLFGLHYRLEIYTPAVNRRFGYYVLPFLYGDRLAARVDLKADRKHGILRVLSAHGERDTTRERIALALADELIDMAGWLGLERVEANSRGDLSRDLQIALAEADP